MLYAASKDALRKKLDGIYTEIQCTDLSEVSFEAVLDKVIMNKGSIVGHSHDFLNKNYFF
jgi:cofilin